MIQQEKINNKKRPSLTAGRKDSNSNMFISLRFIMPNQQSWMCRWVFSVVFPRLILKHILHNIIVVITDGDPQEFLQVDYLMENAIPNAKRVRCGWHIVHQGFYRHVDTTFPYISSTVVDHILRPQKCGVLISTRIFLISLYSFSHSL